MDKMFLENINKIIISNKDIKFIGIKFDENIELKLLQKINYYIIGNDYEDEIGINEQTSEIYILLHEGINKIFVNSSLEKFIECIKCFILKLNLDEDYYEENKRKKVTKEIENEIKTIDKKALIKNNWWKLILEQVRDGLL
jgi:hypothetical protein